MYLLFNRYSSSQRISRSSIPESFIRNVFWRPITVQFFFFASHPSSVGISVGYKTSSSRVYLVFLSSRVTGACPVTTDLIMRVNVRTTTTTTTTTTIPGIYLVVPQASVQTVLFFFFSFLPNPTELTLRTTAFQFLGLKSQSNSKCFVPIYIRINKAVYYGR